MAEQRRRTGLTSGINLLTNLLLQQQQDELSRRRRAEELSVRTDEAFREEIGKKQIQRGVDPRTGLSIPGLTPQPLQPGFTTLPTGEIVRDPSFIAPKPIEPVSFDKEQDVFDIYAPGGIFKGKYPIDPSARKTVEAALEQGRIKPHGTSPEGVGSAIRSIGQTLLKSLPQVASMAESFTPAGIVRGIGTGIGRGISPSKVAPIPSATQAPSENRSSLVSDAANLLSAGRTSGEIVDKLIELGFSQDEAFEIVREAQRGASVR